jgi:hypothetical protein
MKKYPKSFDKIESKSVDESIKSEFSDYFPLGNKPINGLKVTVERFLIPPRRIVYWPLSEMHTNEIKRKLLMFYYINQQCPIFAILTDLEDEKNILKSKLRSRSDLENSKIFIIGGQHTIHVVKVTITLFAFSIYELISSYM